MSHINELARRRYPDILRGVLGIGDVDCEELYRLFGRYEQDLEQALTALTTERQRADELQREVERLRGERDDLHDLIAEYKNASGILVGGDPDGVTPEVLSRHVGRLARWSQLFHKSARRWRTIALYALNKADEECRRANDAELDRDGAYRHLGRVQEYRDKAIADRDAAEARADSEREARVGVEAEARRARVVANFLRYAAHWWRNAQHAAFGDPLETGAPSGQHMQAEREHLRAARFHDELIGHDWHAERDRPYVEDLRAAARTHLPAPQGEATTPAEVVRGGEGEP